MKRIILAWENSRKHAQFQAELEYKRKQVIEKILDLKLKLKDMNNNSIMTNEELEELLDSILLLNEEVLDDADWIADILCSKDTKDDIFVSFIKNVVTWFFYLAKLEREEEYELAGKCQKVIDLEVNELKSILIAKFDEVTDEDVEYIKEIIECYKNEMRK